MVTWPIRPRGRGSCFFLSHPSRARVMNRHSCHTNPHESRSSPYLVLHKPQGENVLGVSKRSRIRVIGLAVTQRATTWLKSLSWLELRTRVSISRGITFAKTELYLKQYQLTIFTDTQLRQSHAGSFTSHTSQQSHHLQWNYVKDCSTLDRTASNVGQGQEYIGRDQVY